MWWLLKKFYWLISLGLLLLGLIYAPADFLEAETALGAFSRTLTVGNREILLALFGAACLWRLGYLDLRRALNDKDWPTVRLKLLRGLALLYRRDLRQAEFRNIADDTELAQLRMAAAETVHGAKREAAEIIRQAEELREMEAAEVVLTRFEHAFPTIVPNANVFSIEEGDNYRNTPDDLKFMAERALSDKIRGWGDPVGQIDGLLNELHLYGIDPAPYFDRLNRASMNVMHRQDLATIEGAAWWPSAAVRQQWHEARAKVIEYGHIRAEISRGLQNKADRRAQARKALSLLPPLLQDTEPEIQR